VEVHFKFSSAPFDVAEVYESRRHAWNTGTAALLWIVSPDRVDVYDAYGRPKDREAEEGYLLRTFGAVEQELARLDAYAGRLAIESGRFWATEQRIRSDERVDSQLLRDLARLEERLIRTGLRRRYAQALIGRTLFLSYLRDRGLVSFSHHPAFGKGVLQSWFQQKDRAYKLFGWLRRTFNGDLFPVEPGEQDAVNARHTALVGDTFANFDPDTGQGELWPYRFDVIPVEFISSIYEQFVHFDDAAEARRTGVHYTPVSIAKLVLDEVLSGAAPNSRVLDLTCGSGVFLVEALRRLVSKGASGTVPSRALIRDTLCSQIYGVDRSEGAIRIAAFSLYLAALELDPDPTPPEALRFDPLVGRTLFVADALGHLPPPIAAGGFDVVVGNPPWTYAGPQPDRILNRMVPLPPRSADFAFVWRSLALGHERARLGVVMRATPFFSRASKSRKTCSALLHAAAPVSIVDLSSLRNELFSSADYSYCVTKWLDRLGRWQHGHLARVRARARAMRTRTVAIELLTWRSGRIGGAARSITAG
jgi:SAM-dependent methyltransferase